MAHILVTDDDPATRLIVAEILKRNGYRVLTAEGGAEALTIIENHGQQVALLLTDLVMPGLNGGDLARRAVALRPDLKVILMSGHRYEDVQRDLSMGQRSVAFLEKPFTSGVLIHQVRGALKSRC